VPVIWVRGLHISNNGSGPVPGSHRCPAQGRSNGSGPVPRESGGFRGVRKARGRYVARPRSGLGPRRVDHPPYTIASALAALAAALRSLALAALPRRA
jgi:hypothetical protein